MPIPPHCAVPALPARLLCQPLPSCSGIPQKFLDTLLLHYNCFILLWTTSVLNSIDISYPTLPATILLRTTSGFIYIYIYIILRYLLSIYCLYASYILVAQHVTSNAASLGIYCRILFYVSPTFYPNSSQVLFSHSHLLSYATYTHYLITTQAYLCTLHWYLQTTHLHPTPHPTGRDDHF